MPDSRMVLVGVAALASCVMVAIALGVFYYFAFRGGSGDAYKGLPTEAMVYPKDLPSQATMQAGINLVFATRSDCWAVNNMARVKFPSHLIRVVRKRLPLPVYPTRAQREALAQTMDSGMRDMLKDLSSCPPDARVVTPIGGEMSVAAYADIERAAMANSISYVRDESKPLAPNVW